MSETSLRSNDWISLMRNCKPLMDHFEKEFKLELSVEPTKVQKLVFFIKFFEQMINFFKFSTQL